jgi:predicted O-methyltransferase YrrM
MKSLARLARLIIPGGLRPRGYLIHLTRARTSCRVAAGPFTGMKYGGASFGSAYLPKLIGIYERELVPVIEKLCSLNPNLIVDIGAAEGYYAVGLALKNPTARIVAYEREKRGRELLAIMAKLNGISSRVEIRGICEQPDIREVLEGSAASVVICDVEGDEKYLLDPEAVVTLRAASILVEVHEFVHPGIAEALRERFSQTHKVTAINQEPRSGSEFPWRTFGTKLLPSYYLEWAVSEGRVAQMSWLWMEPINITEIGGTGPCS